MSISTQPATLSISHVNKLYRKVQGPLQKGYQFMCEEWENMSDLPEYATDWSAREITFPIDLNEGVGATSIPEGGWEAEASSPNVEECTINWILLNAVFTISKTAKFIDQKSARAMIVKQLYYQARKKLQAMMRQYSDMSYGFSTGVLAQCDLNISGASTGTITLKNAYGQSWISGATTAQKRYLSNLFRIGDKITGVHTAAKVFGATITDRDVDAGTIDVTYESSTTVNQTGIMLVHNNSLDSSLGGSSYNRGLIGLLEILFGVSVQNLTHDNWTPTSVDTTAGRFNGMKIHKARQEQHNEGDSSPDTLLMSQGIERDMVVQQSAAVRFSSTFNMEVDGSVKARGLTIKSTRRVPPGLASLYAKKHRKRGALIPNPTDRPAWGDGQKVPHRSLFEFPMDLPCFHVTTNRKAFSAWYNQTEYDN